MNHNLKRNKKRIPTVVVFLFSLCNRVESVTPNPSFAILTLFNKLGTVAALSVCWGMTGLSVALKNLHTSVLIRMFVT